MPKTPRLAHGLIALCLLASLTACATNRVVEVPKIIPVPVDLTEPTPVPELQGNTNGALAEWAKRLLNALNSANDDKQRIRNLK